MKIAISGTAGIGKSTLAMALAEKYNIALIEEGYQVFKDSKQGQNGLDVLQDIFSKKSAEELDAGESCVSDRSPLDLMHICLKMKSYKTERKAANSFIQSCIKAAQNFDFIVLLPWGSFEPQQFNNTQMSRNTDILDLLTNHSSIVGYTHMFVPARRIIELPRRANKLEQRIDMIDKQISRRRPDLFSGDE